MRSLIRLGKILLLDFNQSVILLASDHKLPAARIVTGDARLLFKATYLMIYF